VQQHTGLGLTKKRKKASDRLGGWMDEGRKFVSDMTKKIKSDVDSGLHGEWEKRTYKELCKAINGAERAEEDISKEAMEAECKVMFEEV
jgi:polyhydroxyalkanoate synthesis regulator phasin